MDVEMIQQNLKKKLKRERYRHTLGVMYTAGAMAMRYDADIEICMLAGLLHDCGKFGSVKEQIKLCEDYRITLSDAEKAIPALIHAKLGAYLAKEEYGIENPLILDAILYHTTGRPQMSLTEKIIYLSDYIEPGRRPIPGLAEVRKLAFTDIDSAVCLCAKNTLNYLKEIRQPIDPMTQETYRFYRDC